MASGVTVLPSTSASGKSSDGSRRKRKIASGLPNVRKKVCAPKDTVKAEAARSAGSSKPSVTKWKDTIEEEEEEENTGDSSLEWDAARALTEMQTQVIIEERPPSPQKKVAVNRKEIVTPLVQWSRKRKRSSLKDKGSSVDYNTNSEPQAEQQSEGASSIGKDSHLRARYSAFTPVKVEAPCGSVEQGCASDTEKQNNKLLSDSSCDFPQLDSRAESPTSPLPTSVRLEEVPGFAGFPKLEDGARSSAFQKVIRPLRKPTVARKPKVEEQSYEASAPEQASVKLVTRRKPKPTGVEQLPVVKTEEADAGWPLSSPATVPNECSRSFEDTKCANPRVAAEEVIVSEPVLVKIETKPSVKPGQRAGGKLKPAISESEKEARRQRRVQANRESARQTIRRKQVLCEELSLKSQNLTVENEGLRNELDRKMRELSREKELHAVLKEKLAKCDEGAAGADFTTTTPSENGSGFKYPLPPGSYGQMPMQVHQMHQLYWYAYAAQASGMPQQASEMPLALPGDYATALANAFAMGMPPGYWMGLPQGVTQGGQNAVLPPQFFAHPSVVPGSSKFTPCGEEASSPPTSSTTAVSLPTSQGEGPISLVASGSERGLTSAKSIGAYRASAFSDSSYSHDAKKSSVKCASACEASTSANKAQYYKFAPATQSGLPTSCVGGVLSRSKSLAEEFCVPPVATHLARASSGTLPSHISKTANPRYNFMFTNGGRRYPDMMGQELPTMMATPKPSGQNLKAAEARRRRKDLQRNRALHHRQAARVAEPPVS